VIKVAGLHFCPYLCIIEEKIMKNILWFISFSLMLLLGVKSGDESFQVERAGVESVLQAGKSVGDILPIDIELPDDAKSHVDGESLARQYRVCGRSQRSFSIQRLLFGKQAAYRAVIKSQEILYHSINSVYTSMPCANWLVSSDHYVFGMRRILI
jgi:hypothetical protein